MVRILANGEIVQNDDPRVRKAPQRREDLNRPRQGFIHNSENANHFYQGQANQGHSLFANLNQRLINMGFPRWNLGNQVIEPLISVLLILLLMMFGMRGLLLIDLQCTQLLPGTRSIQRINNSEDKSYQTCTLHVKQQ
ncbi:protein FAM241B-like isoform X2 [Chiloscyllium plagiosum]|uniref:protein FAM241B-like isoform X2 n=1 Tax=Chiloscyllium plagiosum TaxID=36176 RepID=UPI001CB7EDBA|nr:protein FAM241B-like isoform X2 [Chiloscyllium plagiosum]